MSTNRAEWTHPDLHSLAGLFYDDCRQLGEFREIPPEQLEDPWDRLLAHTDHMTVTLEKWHNCPVEVQVLDKRITESHYARKIVLRRQSDRKVVQFGIVRLGKSSLPPDVMRQIESESIPLGRLLIDNNVLRKVKLMSLWQITPGPALRDGFEDPDLITCFGRTALIYANGLPAVELLEIVT